MKSLETAGVPMTGAANMQQAAPGLGGAVQGQLQQADTVGPQIKENFLKQLEQIAQMDQKLGSVYSDPTSPLYTDNVSARERILSGAHSTGSQAVKSITGRYQEHQNELDNQVKETVDFYKELTAMQVKEEARAEKLAKEAARVKAGKGQYATDASGNKIVVPVYKGAKGKKSLEQSVKDSLDRAAELKKQKQEMAHLKDQKAVDFFDNSPAKFQQFWLQHLQDDELPQNGYSTEEVKNQYKYWSDNYKPKKGATSTPIFGNNTTSSNNDDLFNE